jgi:hypothetical protein
MAANASLIEVSGAGEFNGTWDIAVVTDSFDNQEALLRSQVWWGSEDLALVFAGALGPVSGVDNLEYGFGPLFLYASDSAFSNTTVAVWSDGTVFPEGAGAYNISSDPGVIRLASASVQAGAPVADQASRTAGTVRGSASVARRGRRQPS